MFKLYTDKSSIKKTGNRLVSGGFTESSDSKLKWWERLVIPEAADDYKYTITRRYERRPDLLAYIEYGSDNLDWIILQFNNIVDVEEEFVTGRTLTMPSFQRINGDILLRSVRR